MRNRWGPGGPPPEAYSRVTDPERFRPLHSMVETLLGELDSSFEVERTAGYGLDDELETSALALPTVRLTPRDATAAPLVVTAGSLTSSLRHELALYPAFMVLGAATRRPWAHLSGRR